MVWLKKLWYRLTKPYRNYKAQKELEKRIEDMKKRDPFIYK